MTKSAKPKIAGVISSRAEFNRALRMRRPPDLFELRLDAFGTALGDLGSHIEKLGAEIIITARHPDEGGANALSADQRRALLLSFLPHAAWVDIELRSVSALPGILQAARKQGAGIILSFHDFQDIPSVKRLDELARRAHSFAPELFKVAARTDRPEQLARLLEFFDHHGGSGKVVAMGVGKLGRRSRLELARRGCPLNYAHLGTAAVEGQLSIAELRRALR